MSEGRIWRVGVIGAGKHGSRYARHIVNDVDGFELAAISRRSEEGRALAGQWRCRWHADWQDLINDPTVDCLIAALPPMLNREVAAACALARKPLLLEKPMACTVADAEAIGETFYRTGVPLTIGQTLRYNPVIQAFRDRLAQIGPLLGFSTNQRLEPSPLGWMDDPELAGAGVNPLYHFEMVGRKAGRPLGLSGDITMTLVPTAPRAPMLKGWWVACSSARRCPKTRPSRWSCLRTSRTPRAARWAMPTVFR